jgi:hypothetical protein
LSDESLTLSPETAKIVIDGFLKHGRNKRPWLIQNEYKITFYCTAFFAGEPHRLLFHRLNRHSFIQLSHCALLVWV